MRLPRKINSNEVAGAGLWNTLVDYVLSITPRASSDILVRTEASGTTFQQAYKPRSQVIAGELSGAVQEGEDTDYTLIQYAFAERRVLSMAIATSSGTCTAALKIDGVPVTGIDAVSVTSGEMLATATANYSLAVGATLSLTLSSCSDAVGISLTINFD